ncbi:cbb3-type cytochrome c oxidase subunit 3 [Sagittula sp. NFXS13]|uniref:Cytochrome c oxidase cbb3-type subunit 4 n=1 Tax=Sagittula marina TaxID=943940 RepID=A0A7W6DSE9_9RHOB|nr:cbb3-type cytochrome c oxidase subunit 3 [Sagittula marina]MBB3986052.1 cytochrome c oxidase cbb3-type subunit 4 [Sagittula marina]
MGTYDFLRHFADSWGLLAMFVFFSAAVIWALLPGSRTGQSDAANIPFRHDDRPAAEDGADRPAAADPSDT